MKKKISGHGRVSIFFSRARGLTYLGTQGVRIMNPPTPTPPLNPIVVTYELHVVDPPT